mmetsp:Transcript_15095/g.32527  ORF Transcript_15095/g.32527 Transcript_15095/m.32527 type:complete len:247 (-) Transcript_15095:233-973(-)|eukprot:CAMPEP_0206480606 /NCGR_PEP_ID=MMETSP0324_2-20121206/37485_1 /ASSEMBLY_ACC=CAM_ASM_000836 /TAXON_ID=2866 /ORGANISM="Crypthecodinium cohnii, Strain Seligo" /LENGTH=246 /DNA_ID=CAMNT_0053957607 /DNA_START=220 /DNA_END=960 /DNA_ORIENTATION=+
MEDESVAKLLQGLSYKNSDDEAMTFQTHRLLEPGRVPVIASAFPSVGESGYNIYSVTASKDGETKDFIVRVKSGVPASDAEVIMGSCQIMFEDLSPCDCVEYSFQEAPDTWRMSQLGQDALETYRGMKFDNWKQMLVGPTCEAQFRRMLQIGMISQFYDPQLFPTPDDMKSRYQVTDEKTGKLIQLPHPVSGLRVWNAATQSYKDIDTQLTGAPTPQEAGKWWADFVEELKGKHGAEYIDSLITGK